MDPKLIRAALATALAGVTGFDGKLLQSTGYAPDAIDPPWAYPAGSTGTYDETLDGNAGVVWTLRLLTSRSEDQVGQEHLDAFLADEGPSSVKVALEADPTLGGLVDDLAVQGWDGYRMFEVAGTDYYGVELTAVIFA